MEDIRLGLMGCGIVAQHRHLPAIAQLEGIHRTALFSPRLASAEPLAKVFGFDGAYCDETAFWATRPNVVVIASPPGAHLANIRAAAERGVDVICEKPLSLSEKDDEAIRTLVAQSGIRFYVTFCYRFGGISQTIQQLVSAKAIGDLRTLRLIFNWSCRGKYVDEAHRVPNVRRENRMREGGPMIDCGVHLIDLARHWSGSDPVHWCGHGSWADDYAAPDHIWVHLDHASGVHTMAECSFSYGHKTKGDAMLFAYDIIGTDGFIHYDKSQNRFELNNAVGVTTLPQGEDRDFLAMYKAFFAHRAGQLTEPLPSVEDSIIATRIARAATEEAIQRNQSL